MSAVLVLIHFYEIQLILTYGQRNTQLIYFIQPVAGEQFKKKNKTKVELFINGKLVWVYTKMPASKSFWTLLRQLLLPLLLHCMPCNILEVY